MFYIYVYQVLYRLYIAYASLKLDSEGANLYVQVVGGNLFALLIETGSGSLNFILTVH